MKIFAKAACFLAVLTMSQAAFAQITLDLDVLTEDFVPKNATTSAPVLKKPESAKTEKKEKQKSVPLKPPAAKKAEKPKAKPAAKPAAPKKPAAKTVKKAEKLEIKESAVKDEHDKLKPRANPVPKVKVLAVETREVKAPEEKPEVIIEPKISKHFLEQERLKLEEEKAQAEAAAVRETPAPAQKQNPVKTEQALNKSEPEPKTDPINETVDRENARRQTPKMLLTPKIRKEQTAAQPATPVLKSSVFHVSNRLTPDERSALLSKEIPEDSATRLALTKDKKLVQIFLFEENSADLTEEMQIALNSLAARLKKNPEKRLTLYSYSAPNPSGNGRERQVSLRRALMVRSYLSRLGVRSLRVEIRSQGQKGAGTAIPDRTDILIED